MSPPPLPSPLPLKKRLEIFQALQTQTPHPKTELLYTNPFTLLVAVVLSAQTTDKAVNNATKTLFKIADKPQDFINLGAEGLIPHIQTIGLFNNKAKNVVALSKILAHANLPDVIPKTREDLEALPGVGRKTANVVLNAAFNQPVIAVDTHVSRVANRLRIGPGHNPLQVEVALEKNIPSQFKQHAHHWLVLHGRYVCKSRKPNCPSCVLLKLCPYTEKTSS